MTFANAQLEYFFLCCYNSILRLKCYQAFVRFCHELRTNGGNNQQRDTLLPESETLDRTRRDRAMKAKAKPVTSYRTTFQSYTDDALIPILEMSKFARSLDYYCTNFISA
jgi:hypothetical protein